MSSMDQRKKPCTFMLAGAHISLKMQDTEARTQALLCILLVHHLNGVDRQRLLLHQRQGARHLRSEETKDGLC